VVRGMTLDLALPVEVVGAPTVRAADGLALSSRNAYLSAAQRALAPAIYRALHDAVTAIDQGASDYAMLEREGAAALQSAGMNVDYFSIRNAADLAKPDPGATDLVVLAAARLGRARLIDNLRARGR
jgi:pantoate--beta-alanine ligase